MTKSNDAKNSEDEGLGAPASITFRTEEELKSLLLESLRDPRPSIEATPEFWEGIQQQVNRPPGSRSKRHR